MCLRMSTVCILCQLINLALTLVPIRIGFMINTKPYLPFTARTMGGAFTLGLEAAQTQAIPGVNITYVMSYSDNSNKKALAQLVDMVYKDNITALIGPTFSGASEATALLTSQWNIPQIGYVSESEKLSDKTVYDTFCRTQPTKEVLANSIIALLKMYKWRHVAILAPLNRGHWTTYFRSTETALDRGNFTLSVINFEIGATGGSAFTFRRALVKLSKTARVVILLAWFTDVKKILVEAYDLGLIQTGEYVFILVDSAINLDQVDLFGSPEDEPKLRAAYESVLIVERTYPPELDNMDFKKQVMEKQKEYPFFINLTSPQQVAGSAAYLYDAVMLYALALNKTLEEGKDPRDGREFFKTVLTISFQGKSGRVSVNKNGDRNQDFTINDFNGTHFHVIGDYDAQQDGYFPRSGVTVRWPGRDSPPLDIPICGFESELCATESTYDWTPIIVIIVLVLVTAAGTIVGFIFYRKRVFESDLLSAAWKINYADIVFGKIAASRLSQLSANHIGSMSSAVSIENHVLSRSVGTYQSQTVFLKHVNKTDIDIKNRNILIELKMMKDLRHENLVLFVGACVMVPNVNILTIFCSKGSLQDVIENDDIKLDWMFKMSFTMDIVSGVSFLHHSDMKTHGNLKSPNCLVDSRWVIKLSDYGLHYFKATTTSEQDDGEYAKFHRMLWTAPELLRQPTVGGTQRGDIYSLGVILQEIFTRTSPFPETNLSPKEIIEKVIMSPPFRPDITKDIPTGVRDLIYRCWEENPSNRPDIDIVLRSLKKINKGKSVRIMDNMVLMLEKYANNLEEIVAERTEQLVMEKKKTDELLYRMLPRSVADQLKTGKSIDAETFEEVTIFFSDIVGFTSMSAQSTPLEVVDFLNDLYSMFDDTIKIFDVYKVETIGDAYMVVSGLPIRNGHQHAAHIADMALELLSCVNAFKIRHLPDRKLQLRVGIHTGPCVAGVVGLTMPRYCLFGDTVNTASRMESNGKALRIHVSPFTKKVLDLIGGYNLDERGQVEMKGKGSMTTYWLVGRKGFYKPLPEIALNDSVPF